MRTNFFFFSGMSPNLILPLGTFLVEKVLVTKRRFTNWRLWPWGENSKKPVRRWEDEQFGLLLNDSWSVRHTWKLLDIQAAAIKKILHDITCFLKPHVFLVVSSCQLFVIFRTNSCSLHCNSHLALKSWAHRRRLHTSHQGRDLIFFLSGSLLFWFSLHNMCFFCF